MSRKKFALRGHQPKWLEDIDRDLTETSRVLVVAPGGIGKTGLMGQLALRYHERGMKTLVIENRDRLVGQAAQRISDETGLDVDIEMGDEHASPFAPVVVASIQTMGRMSRLMGFSDSHFGLILIDEAHFSLAPQFQRVSFYFHYGAESLTDGWTAPLDGEFVPKCRIAGFTATPDIGERKNLGQFFQKKSVDYSYLQAVEDGWLVSPIQKSIPVKIDLRKYKVGGTINGTDFNTSNLAEALIPVIEEIADHIVKEASDRKTIAFLPSVECARMMADAIRRRGLKSIFVSGECLDADDKADDFGRAGKGTVLCNAVLFNYGVDFPDVDCVAWLRATLSKAFYIQGIYRGTRVLPGTVDGLETAELRRAAIAASEKRNLLILDPFFVSDRIDLCDPYALFTDKPEVREKMKAGAGLNAESARQAERDFLAALAKEARKHARKQARVINPLAWAVSLGDAKLATYVPETAWDSQPITPQQTIFLQRHHVDVTKIRFKGLANKVIGTIMKRLDLGLATVGQLDFLHRLGVEDEVAATLTRADAKAMIDATLASKHERRTLAQEPEPVGSCEVVEI